MMAESEQSSLNYYEDALRYYIQKNPKDFGLDCVKGTNIVGTPDVPALRDGKPIKIELKISTINIINQLLNGKKKYWKKNGGRVRKLVIFKLIVIFR